MRNQMLLSLMLLSAWLPAGASPAFNMPFRCEEMQPNIQAIQKWTLSRGNTCALNTPPSLNIGNGQCTVDVNKCLPDEVLAWDGTAPQFPGPNCWNLAMTMTGILPALRYSSAEEMTFFMKSPLCRRLNANEKPEPGDIGAMRSNGSEVHAFIWISDTLVFSKNGDAINQKYLMQSRSFMQDGYQLLQNAICAKTQNPADCKIDIDTFRCQPLKSYINDPRSETPQVIAKTLENLDQVDTLMKPFHFTPRNFKKAQMRELVSAVETVAADIRSPNFKNSMAGMRKPQRDFASGTFLVRMKSMLHQLNLSHKETGNCPSCATMIDSLNRSYYEILDDPSRN